MKHCEICERRLNRNATKATVCKGCKDYAYGRKPGETQRQTIARNKASAAAYVARANAAKGTDR